MSGAESAERRAEAGRWLAIADEDVAAARLCLAASPPLAAVAAYHCQQAVEKIAKALLVFAGRSFPKTHDIDTLSDLVAPLYSDVAARLSVLEPTTVWGYAYRYPSEEEGAAAPPPADIARRLREIEALRQAAEAAMRTSG